MRYTILLGFLLFAVPACAGNDDLVQPQLGASCAAYLPIGARDAIRADVTLRAHLLKDGAPTNITIDHASGNAEADDAALRCATTWRFNSPETAGKAIRFLVRIFEPIPHYCSLPEEAKDSSGITELKYVIRTDGHTGDREIASSSGDTKLDELSLNCVKFFRYRPAVRNDTPIAVPWTANIYWNQPVPSKTQHSIQARLRVDTLDVPQKSGITVLSYDLRNGVVYNLKLDQSSGNTDLDDAALRCASERDISEDIYVGKIPTFKMREVINWAEVTAKPSSH